MLCYLDRTFCSRRTCPNQECPRRLTDEVWEGAQYVGLPLALADLKSDDCGFEGEDHEA